MRPTLLMPLMIFGLAGCGSEPDGEISAEKSADQVIAQVSQMAKPLPGLYETTAELKDFSISGIPAEQLGMMKQQFAANSNKTDTMCLTKADADQGFEKMLREMGEMSQAGEGVDCAFSQFDASGSKLNAVLGCTGPGGMKMAMNMDGTVAPDRSDMTMTMNSSSSMMPGQEMTMVMQTASRRIGDCPA